MLERLLGRKPARHSAGPRRQGMPEDALLAQFFRNLVAPHIVAGTDARQPRLLEVMDRSLAMRMRAVLHHPDFQSLESIWRSIHWFVSRISALGECTTYLLDASKAALQADREEAGGDGTRSTLDRLLNEGRLEAPWTLLVGSYSFAASTVDLALLDWLGAAAARAGAPILCGADVSLIGCGSLNEATAHPSTWTLNLGEGATAWQALRRSTRARSIGLAIPCFLLRLPYGKRTDRIESFGFEELGSDRRHEDYLWGNPAYAVASIVVGSLMSGNSSLHVEDLPSHVYNEGGETQLQPCAEVFLSDRAGEAVLEKGPMPLLSYRDRNAVRLLRLQSIADPPAAIPT